MTHRRSVVATEVVTRLSSIPDFAGAGKCARGRAAAVPLELLPALTVTWGEAGEISTRRPMSGPNGEDGYDRTLPLSVVVHLRVNDPEGEFDRICSLIEAKMEADVSLDGITIDLDLQSTRLFVDPRTGIPMSVGSLLYSIRYKTLATDPSISAL